MFYDFLWSDPEPDNLTESGSGSGQKVRILQNPVPDPTLQHWVPYTVGICFHNNFTDP